MKSGSLFWVWVLLLSSAFTTSVPPPAWATPASPPVGFYRLVIPAESDAFCSLPFLPFTSTIDHFLQGQLIPSSSQEHADAIFIWNTEAQVYEPFFLLGDPADPAIGHWVSPSLKKVALYPGQGFVLRNNHPFQQTVYLTGHLLFEETVTLSTKEGVNLLGTPYAQVTAQLGTTSWKPGQGLWFISDSDHPLVFDRPYPSVSEPTTSLPDVVNILPCKDHKSVILAIKTTGKENESLAIYFQDADPSVPFSPNTGWLLAENKIETHGQNLIYWEDLGHANRAPPSNVSGRFYIVRSDHPLLEADVELVPPGEVSDLVPTDGHRGDPGSNILAASHNTRNYNRGIVASRGDSKAKQKNRKTIYVDGIRGNDLNAGKEQHALADERNGPVRTIRKAISMIQAGDNVVILEGPYQEDLDISGRDINVRIVGKVIL